MNRPNSMRIALLAAGLLLIAACGTIIQQPAPSQLYTLRPLTGPTELKGEPSTNLIIARPIVSPGLERELIALIKPDHQLSYYAQARWSAPTAELVRFFLIDSLQNQGIFQSVTPDLRFARNNYRLDVHIQDFQAEYAKEDASPTVRLKLAFTLTDLAKRSAAATFVESVELPVEENQLSAVVGGFQEAMNRVTRNAIAKIGAAVARPIP